MKTVQQCFESETEAKRSKFFAHLVPIGSFEEMRSQLRRKHPKASHIVWAARFVNPHGQIVEESSDDGEPKGCAGRPVLHVMQGKELMQCAVLVVRYFGGIKLGTGGMARAYSAAAQAVAAAAELKVFERRAAIHFFTAFGVMRRWEHFLESVGDLKVDRTFRSDGTAWSLEGGETAVKRVEKALKEARIDFSVEYH
ncbi:YigZ family protein [Hydrogenimonas cancrithermarum]|uniref:Phosphoenolpyruvate carboxykinase n=1 Tax=Hydrogenimonas cancrithermarum TaxID=2993563 RepID=A0ABM8FHM5_9BACT|nr:YigZ family protein [Hydrogenimonas cancrithermarum]BDY11793.1 phosphoenolpyruvate carboxykinase [Hydrogenimonas cancrithermarum]